MRANMCDTSVITQYLNLMAELLAVMESTPIPVCAFDAVEESQWLPSEQMDKVEAAFAHGVREACATIRGLLERVVRSDEPTRYVHAYQLVLCMDAHMGYGEAGKEACVDLGKLGLALGGGVTVVGALNDNCAQTGIWLNPKLGTAEGFFCSEGRRIRRKVANRDALYKMNAVLRTVSYTRYDESLLYKNIVLPHSAAEVAAPDFKVAFSPILGFKDPLVLSYPQVYENGLRQRGIGLEGHRDLDDLDKRFAQSWMRACAEGAGIYFACEMMGIPRMYEERDGRSPYMAALCARARKAGLTPPRLTILPGMWEDGVSWTLLVGDEGLVLGRQVRHARFVDRAERMVEYVTPMPRRQYCIVHLPGLYRIGVLICAEFLPQEGNDAVERLCRDLGCNLLIVPSYTAGEYDYIMSLAIAKPYGTSVVWGNCCGANHYTPTIIGGVSVAGTDYVGRMGSFCECGHVCAKDKGCAFIISLPTRTEMGKPDSMSLDSCMRHHVMCLHVDE